MKRDINLHLGQPAGKLAKYGLKLLLIFFSICTISSLSALFFSGGRIGLYFNQFFDMFTSVITNLINLENATVFLSPGQIVPVTEYLPEAYAYSMTILFTSLCCSLLLAFVCAYLYLYLPFYLKKVFSKILQLSEALPDILLIMLFQYGVILLYQSTGMKLFQLYAIGSKVYFTPIICLLLVPFIMLLRIMVTIFDEEYQKTYVDFAKAKGLSRNRIFFRHVLRNIIYSILLHLNVIYWIMLSSLILVEYLFKMEGFTLLLHRFMSPEVLSIGIILILIPFGLIFFLTRVVTNTMTRGEIR